jgi:glycosyltransferase involved in cell wall biosynthesis
MVNSKISILLSTYNSESFLKEQIESILNQTITDWILYIRDDGSSDNTVSIIQKYCLDYENIIYVKDDLHNLGAKNSFIKLLTDIDSTYYMFCDHDDVWLPFKIERTLLKMKETESLHPNKPILIFTDLKVVDANLNLINSSLWTYQKTDPQHSKNTYSLSIANPVTGCTIMINKKAKEVSLPMSPKSLMHDLWIALNVSKYGFIDFVPEPTMLYRQHRVNVIGAKETNFMYYFLRFKNLKNVLRDNILMIQMINSLNFKMNHLKRFVLKFRMVILKFFH